MAVTFASVADDLATMRQVLPLRPKRYFSSVHRERVNELHREMEEGGDVTAEQLIYLDLLNDDLARCLEKIIWFHLQRDAPRAAEGHGSSIWYMHYVLLRRLGLNLDLVEIVKLIPDTDPTFEAIFDSDPHAALAFADRVTRPGSKAKREEMERLQKKEMMLLRGAVGL